MALIITDVNINSAKPQEMNMRSAKLSKASIIHNSKNPAVKYIQKYEDDILQNAYLEKKLTINDAPECFLYTDQHLPKKKKNQNKKTYQEFRRS